jgi:hypothetical protein
MPRISFPGRPGAGLRRGALGIGLGLSFGGRAPAAAPDYPTRWGAVANYALDEAAGANDAIAALGGQNLTQHGSPGSQAGIIGTARLISSVGTKYFSHADTVLFRQGAFDMAWAGWLYSDAATLGLSQAVLSKDGGTAGYHLRLTNANQLLFISRQTGGADYARITSSVVLAANTWYFFLVCLDFVNAQLTISVNGGAFETPASGTGMPGAGSAEFQLGHDPSGGDVQYRGALDEVSLFKSPPGGLAGVKTELRDRLYNSGAGRAYPWS